MRSALPFIFFDQSDQLAEYTGHIAPVDFIDEQSIIVLGIGQGTLDHFFKYSRPYLIGKTIRYFFGCIFCRHNRLDSLNKILIAERLMKRALCANESETPTV